MIKVSGGIKKAPAKKSVKKDSADDIAVEVVEETKARDLTEELVGDLGINTSELAQALQSEFGMSEWDLIPVIKSTGIRIIDALLSSEEDFVGLTQRTINTLYGDSGIGKTTFWLQAAANMVKDTEAGQIVIWDAEKTTTRQRLTTLGLPLNRVTLIKKDTSIEKFFSMCKTVAIMRHKQMEEHGEGYLMDNPYIFVVDSIAAMSTNREEEADTDINKAMGVPARMWSALLKTYNDVFFKYNMTVLFVNQVRDKIAMTAADMKKDLVYSKHTESLGGDVSYL